MPSGSATVTAPIGPGRSATALAISNIRTIVFDTRLATVRVQTQTGRWVDFDANATATISATAASGVFTFTVNQ